MSAVLTAQGDFEAQERSPLLAYFEAFSRRSRHFWISLMLGLAAVLGLTFGLPSYYKSTATILIEQQEIPNDMVRTTISSFADQRLQMTQQRVMTRDNLLALIGKYDLYPDDREDMPTEDLLELLGNRIDMSFVTGQFIDPRRGVPTEATIAFEIGFTDRSAEKAFKVANELFTLYHEENLRNRAQLVEETSSFLEIEAEKLDQRVRELEAEVAAFKERHVGELPELLSVNWQLYERTDAELQEISRTRRRLEDQVIYLESELAGMSPYDQIVSESGARILSPADRLAALQSELAQMRARYSPEHPDLQRIRSDIAGLEEEVDTRDRTRSLYQQLELLRSQLAGIRERYSEDHPDVVLLRTQIASLLKTLGDKVDDSRIEIDPTNPSYIQVQTRLESIRLELNSLDEQERAAKRKRTDLETRISNTPGVERTFSELAREYRNAAQKFTEVHAKQLEAELAESLEKDRKGEKFTLIDPPRVAEKPVSPNRLLIFFLGLVLSFGLSIGIVALAESLDDRVYGKSAVAQLLGVAPMAAIPVIVTRDDRNRARTRLVLATLALTIVLALSVLAVHLFLVPIDLILARIQTVLGL